MIENTKVLVLGASGMLGNSILRLFYQTDGYSVIGTVRSGQAVSLLPENVRNFVLSGIDVLNVDSLIQLMDDVRPDLVINCVGVVKQLSDASNPLVALPINSLFPHRLAHICSISNARLVHMSTDCVFTGNKGMYTEHDVADAQDLYGVSKRLGEVDYSNAITLRTSIIGHELNGSRSLIDWFLAQEDQVKGYTNAIFSGLPTIEIGKLIRDYVIPNPDLRGVYHVSAAPINKYDLLSLVAKVYGKKITIEPDGGFKIDRSLDSSRFRRETGFISAPWPELIRLMNDFM